MTHRTEFVNAYAYCHLAGASLEEVVDISEAGFMARGENVLFIGGPATGKLLLARASARSAELNGKTVAYLNAPTDAPHDALLEPLFHAGNGWTGGPRVHRKALLESDLLVVDEADRWLEVAPLVTVMLLCMRAEQGRSTILVADSDNWHRMLDEGRFSQALQSDNYSEFEVLSQCGDSEWLRFIKRSYGALMARRELFASLGLDVIATAPHLQRAPSRFGRHLGWHVVTVSDHSRLRFFRSQF
ncbi:MAG: ATP-binding protein [Cyanobacteria bacterium SZAS LIN-2]|nr:ATP-binding protein [Cyanobacteria bacterium SZAS LIN-2]